MTSGFALLMNGALVILAIILFFFALKSKKNTKMYLHFALADITYFIYNFEYIYRFSVMELSSFLILRKILISSVFFSSFFLMIGTKEYTHKDKLFKPILLGFIVCILAIVSAPNFYLLKIIIDISNLFLIICLVYILIIGFQASKSTLYFSCTFLMLTIIQVTLINIFKFDIIYTLNYGIFVFFSVLSLTIVLNFSDLEKRVFLLNNIAKTDPLTGLGNRSTLEDYIFSKTDTLMFIDVNDFKNINDSYGHDKGDEILKIVSKVLMAHTRKNDICIRYGGDEFLIIFKDLEINHAKMHASLIYNNLLTNTEKISIS